jgi:hypothetical protein
MSGSLERTLAMRVRILEDALNRIEDSARAPARQREGDKFIETLADIALDALNQEMPGRDLDKPCPEPECERFLGHVGPHVPAYGLRARLV